MTFYYKMNIPDRAEGLAPSLEGLGEYKMMILRSHPTLNKIAFQVEADSDPVAGKAVSSGDDIATEITSLTKAEYEVEIGGW